MLRKLVLLTLYPFWAPLLNLHNLCKSVWNSRIIYNDIEGYSAFDPLKSLVAFFYHTATINFNKYGINGNSDYFSGVPGYKLKNLFQYNYIPLWLYWKSSNLTVLIAMGFWSLSFFPWISQSSLSFVVIVMLVGLSSTLYYFNLFRQNYNVIGWAFFPLMLYFLMIGNVVGFSVCFLAIGISSITVSLMAYILAIAYIVFNSNFSIIVGLVPCSLYYSYKFANVFFNKNTLRSFVDILKVIGVYNNHEVTYKRNDINKMGKFQLFVFLQLVAFASFVFFFTGHLSPLLLFTGIIFIVNGRISRFADVQSMMFLVLSVVVSEVAYLHNWIVLLTAIFILNPYPFFRYGFRGPFPYLPLSPVYIGDLLKNLRQFISYVKANQTVLICLEDPQNTYEKLFSDIGKRIDVIHYLCNEIDVKFFPQWRAIFDSKFKFNEFVWGRSLSKVAENVSKLNVDYIIHYTNNSKTIENEWFEKGFEVVDKFNWGEYPQLSIKGNEEISDQNWWLLKCPDRS